MEFEWDEDKRQSNLAKHDIDFEDVDQLFDGRHAYTAPSAYQLEARYLTVGNVDGRYITAIWTRRGKVIRIISARRARKKEVALLHE
jgi:uncharacterized DUF497 family protein